MVNGLWLHNIDRMHGCAFRGCQVPSVGLVSKVATGKDRKSVDPNKETRVTGFYCTDHEEFVRDLLIPS